MPIEVRYLFVESRWAQLTPEDLSDAGHQGEVADLDLAALRGPAPVALSSVLASQEIDDVDFGVEGPERIVYQVNGVGTGHPLGDGAEGWRALEYARALGDVVHPHAEIICTALEVYARSMAADADAIGSGGYADAARVSARHAAAVAEQLRALTADHDEPVSAAAQQPG